MLDIYEIFQDLFSLFLFGEGWQTVCSYGSIKQKKSGDFCLGKRYLLAYLIWKKWINDVNWKKREGIPLNQCQKHWLEDSPGKKKKTYTPQKQTSKIDGFGHHVGFPTLVKPTGRTSQLGKIRLPQRAWRRRIRLVVLKAETGGRHILLVSCRAVVSWLNPPDSWGGILYLTKLSEVEILGCKMQNTCRWVMVQNTSVGQLVFSKGSFSSFENPTGCRVFSFRIPWMYALL